MVKGRDVVCREANEAPVRGAEEEEKRRRAKAEAAERAMHATRMRDLKMTEVAVFLWCGAVLKERREAYGLDGSSSWVGICVGFVDAETE